jgi:hypothetical protein
MLNNFIIEDYYIKKDKPICDNCSNNNIKYSSKHNLYLCINCLSKWHLCHIIKEIVPGSELICCKKRK